MRYLEGLELMGMVMVAYLGGIFMTSKGGACSLLSTQLTAPN